MATGWKWLCEDCGDEFGDATDRRDEDAPACDCCKGECVVRVYVNRYGHTHPRDCDALDIYKAACLCDVCRELAFSEVDRLTDEGVTR